MTYNFSTVHGFGRKDLKAIIDGVNTTLGGKPFRLVNLDIKTQLITADSLDDARKQINKWAQECMPTQGWAQNFSTKRKWLEGFKGFDDTEIPLHAEFACGNGSSLLVKHVGGFEWRLVTICESGGNLCAAQDFSLLCNENGIERLNYTQYWDGKDGALIPFMERFTGFTLAEKK